MPATGVPSAATTGGAGPRLPAGAAALRLPLYDRSQVRLAERWGFDLNAADAADRAERLLSEAPGDADRLLLAAAVRSSRGDAAGALEAARQAVAAAPGSARAQTTLAALLAGSEPAEARRHADRAVELDPSDPAAIYNRGLVSWTLGEHGRARADFDRAAELLRMAPLPWWRRWRTTR
jgi:tetratricopeptide (TPR) repeat protein